MLDTNPLLSLPNVHRAMNAEPRNLDESGRGAIFTRRIVVDFILDLVGYTQDKDLYKAALLEPSFGNGEFLIASVERLLASRARAKESGKKVGSIKGCIQAVEVHRETYERTRELVICMLEKAKFSRDEALSVVESWLICGDFLLLDLRTEVDFIVGNPPYVRQELIPAALLKEYRRRFSTLYDRADLYVPFIERSLALLGNGGQLSFICSNRWMKNKYGAPLRAHISEDFHLRAYVDMVDADAFHSEVSAYPAITVIAKEPPGPTMVAKRPELESKSLSRLAAAIRGEAPKSRLAKSIPNVASGSAAWIFESSNLMQLVRRIEEAYPALEEVGCKVGIGVATGADKVFIANYEKLDVEPSRKLPIAMTRDIADGEVIWQGGGIINPFTDEGPLVDLAQYPKLREYLEKHRAQIEGRHVSQKSPKNWYRTIDRITPSLARRPKLLIPDIKGNAHVVFEDGQLYPHHNLYYVVSDAWDLRALQAVLLSNLTHLFISAYSTKMRGGYLRFQAQYLRKIRLPKWEQVSKPLRKRLALAALTLDIHACNEAVADLYSLTAKERLALTKQA